MNTTNILCVTVNNPTVPATTGYDTLTARLFWSLSGESERDLRGGGGGVVEQGVGVGGLDGGGDVGGVVGQERTC